MNQGHLAKVLGAAFLLLGGAASAAPPTVVDAAVTVPMSSAAQSNPVLTGFTFEIGRVLVGPDVSGELIPAIQASAIEAYDVLGTSCSGGRGGTCRRVPMSLKQSATSAAVPFANGSPVTATFEFGLLNPQSMSLTVSSTNPSSFGAYSLELRDVTNGKTIAPDSAAGTSFASLPGGTSYQLALTASAFTADKLTIVASLAAPAAAPEPKTHAALLVGLALLGVVARHRPSGSSHVQQETD